jgi:hypothetical protein
MHPVPGPDADSSLLGDFALSYDGYARHGGVAGLGALVGPLLQRWETTGELPADLDTLRALLFWCQRAHRHADGGWTLFGDDDFVRALVAAIAEVSGGIVDADRT